MKKDKKVKQDETAEMAGKSEEIVEEKVEETPEENPELAEAESQIEKLKGEVADMREHTGRRSRV